MRMPTRAVDRRRARAVAAAAAQQATSAGVALPADLRIWALAGWSPGASADGAPEAADGAGGADGGGGADGAGGAGGGGGGAGKGGGEARAGREADNGDRVGEVGELAVVLEQATSARRRKAKGLHVTPAWLADHLVERCLAAASVEPAPECGPMAPHSGAGSAGAMSVCDPACGGGAFLIAAARGLEARGHSRQEIIRDLLWGADVDPVGLAAAEVALALWAGEAPPPGHLVAGDALARGAALWRGAPVGGFGAVVGNPPFLSQLGRATTRPAAETERLRARFGEAVRMYTDAAWLFLLLGCDLVRPGGAVTMVQPLSVVAARDAAAVRAALGERAHLHELWVEDRHRRAFAAAVQVCAPVLTRSTGEAAPAGPSGGGSEAQVETIRQLDGSAGDPAEPEAEASPQPAAPATAGEAATDRAWADRLADAVGVPAVEIDESACVRLGALAEVAAGFRDEYYGLVPLVREAEPPGGGHPLGDAERPAGGDGEQPRGGEGERLRDGQRPSDAERPRGGEGERLSDGQRLGEGEQPGGGDAERPGGGEGERPGGGEGEQPEGGEGERPSEGERPGVGDGEARLVTTGALDWGRTSWGERPARFAKRIWNAPVVDAAAAAALDPAHPVTRAVWRWLERTSGPKLLVASQTRVVELAVDPGGRWVPSVPTLAVVPRNPDDLWLLAAAVSSPTATAWLWRRAPGTALSRDALKVAARDLADLPLPSDRGAWEQAAAAFRAYVEAPDPAAFGVYAEAAARAYGASPELVAWWRDRAQSSIDSTRGG